MTLDDLQQNWPGWNIRRGETLWKATRRAPKPNTPPGFSTNHGHLVETILEDGPHELLAALENQAAIEQELAEFRPVAR
jgi:hypothetical protein